MKIVLRKELKQKRNQLTKTEVSALSTEILARISKHFDLEAVDTVALYHPFSQEVDVIPLIERLIAKNKKVVLPKVLSKTTMEFFEITSLDDVSKSQFGVLEPTTHALVRKEAIDIMLIPGVGFNTNCYRLGYGAGYYDRYLKDSQIMTIGVCYDFQITDDFDTMPHDIPLEYVITENRLLQHRNEGLK